MKIIDLKLHIDGLRIEDGGSVEEYIEKVKAITDSNYEIQYEILYEEKL